MQSLDDEEERTWRAFVAASRTVSEGVNRRLVRDARISGADLEILISLSVASGRSLRMSRLASESSISPSRLSHAVARLEQKGWVLRRRSTGDRRGMVAELTPAGGEFVSAALPAHARAVRAVLLDRLSAQQHAGLRAALEALVAQL